MIKFTNAAVLFCVVILGFASLPAEAKPAPKIDPRLVGSWWNGVSDGNNQGTCTKWDFNNDGTGMVSHYCTGMSFNFTVAGGKIKFSNAQNCGLERCSEVKMQDCKFSFSDDGQTLILGTERLKKIVNGRVDGKWAGCC